MIRTFFGEDLGGLFASHADRVKAEAPGTARVTVPGEQV
jgi:hypothetical protein